MKRFCQIRADSYIIRLQHLLRTALFVICGTLMAAASGYVRAADYARDTIFNEKLSDDDFATLERGQILIRNIQYTKNICILPGISPQTDEILDILQKLRPQYLAEIMYKIPYEGNEQLLEQVEQVFLDIPLYKKIRYYPDFYDGAECPLFSTADELERTTVQDRILIKALFAMDPFSVYHAELTVKRTENSFLFTQTNKDKIKYQFIKMVSPDKMKAAIAVVHTGNYWFVYAAGGVNAPRIPFLKRRLEAAFIGRIRDFSKFYINLLDLE